MHQQIVSGYNQWASSYDSVENKTRDLEGLCLRQLLGGKKLEQVVEMACGTGKNTRFLQDISKQLLAFDASEGMLIQARQKINVPHVQFAQANLLEPWPVADAHADAVVFSLVLEHIEDLWFPFAEAARVLRKGGLLYVGELHPFKQYLGSVARFETETETIRLPAYTHHFSQYFEAGLSNSLRLTQCLERAAPNDAVPRILALLFEKI